ncbi:MAG: helix-turn-helix domain-containing protein [Polyangiales bacterium]
MHTRSGATAPTIPPHILDLAIALAAVLAPRPSSSPDDLLPLADAARIAATSLRTTRDAIRTGELPATGRQRDRAVRRADLDKWIESRAVKPHAAIDDADIERRMRRLAGDSR